VRRGNNPERPVEILLVDDNADFLKLMKQALFANGYTVYTAEDGIEACELLTTQNIDLIISDIRMPRFDGLKLHAFARELDRHRETKFIFLSAFKDIYRDTLPLNPALDYFVDKTASPDEVIGLVDKLVFGRFATNWRGSA
jgi:two-component system alkaline phosphatase synthesis response regulator PhoP